MTAFGQTLNNVVSREDPNDDWLLRAGLHLKSTLADCLQRAKFHGRISVTLIVKDSSVIGIDSDTNQTIRQ